MLKRKIKFLASIFCVILALLAARFLLAEDSVKVLNPHSNPELGGFWDVNFETYGENTLHVRGFPNTPMPEEVEISGIYCGEKSYDFTPLKHNQVSVKNWSCNDKGRLRLKVNSSGSHKVELRFGKNTSVAKNFACDSGTLSDTCTVSTTQAMTNGETISGTGNLTIASGGNLTTTNTQSFTINLTGPTSTVTVSSGGAITGNVTINAIDLSIGATGIINGNEKGQLGGTRANGSGAGAGLGGASGEIGAGGAGYGGGGGAGDDYAGGGTYGSVTAPSDYGSGGGGGNYGGATTVGGKGGGVLRLNITNALSMTSGAIITANGGNSGCSDDGGGGGSGGSVYITAATVSGTGTVRANGGNGGTACSADDGGGGGGGRVSIIASSTLSATVTRQAYGGTAGNQGGGAGTIYESVAGTSTLISDNNLSPSSLTGALTSQVTGTSLSVNNVTIKGGARYKIITGSTLTMTASAFSTTSTMASIENEGTLTLPSTFSIPANLIFITDATGTVSGLTDLTVSTSGTFTMENYLNNSNSTPFSLTTLTVNGTVNSTTNALSGSTKTHTVNISATTITVGSTGTIHTNALGFAGGNRANGTGPGAGLGAATGEVGAGGAGYGGAGGAGSDYAGGSTYGSATAPVDLGSGGGGGNYGGTTTIGGNGGGAIKLTVTGTLTVNASGTISANGGSSGCSDDGGGGGSGGSIYIITNTLTGSGNIRANGGNGALSCGADMGGGGGGGRIIVGYISKSYTESLATVTGGSGLNSGSAGTLSFVVLVPAAPTTLYSDDTDASAGSANPTDLVGLTPVFSAICNTVDGQCTHAEIEVSVNSNYSSPIWQSGSINIADVNNAARIADITYSGSGLSYSTTYYWRIRFNNVNGAGAWSTEAVTFFVPRYLELYSFTSGGSVQGGQTLPIRWGSYGGASGQTVKIEYSANDFSSATTIAASVSSESDASIVRSYDWAVPSANTICGSSSCNNVKIRISSNNDGNSTAVTSETAFTVQGSPVTGLSYGRTFSAPSLYTSESGLTYSSGNVGLGDSNWYNPSWNRRAAITITNNVATTLTDFQVRVPVTYDADMQADFDDIRFTSSDQVTALDFWLESKTDSSSAVFFVEIPSIPSSSTATIYLYYGNSGASSASNINNTFIAGDNFDGPSLDAEWTQVSTGGSSAGTFSTGKWTKTCSGECDWWSSTDMDAGIYITDPSPSATWEAVTYLSASSSPTSSHVGIMLYQALRDGISFGKYFSGSTIYSAELTGSGNLCTISNTSAASYLKIRKTSGNGAGVNNTYNFFRGDNSGTWTQCASYTATDIMTKVGLFVKDWSSGTTSGTFDFFFVRKYASTEPTVSIGSEQTASTSTKNIVFAAGHDFLTVSNFAASKTGDGDVKFQVSSDNGSTWKYCVGDTLTTATNGYSHANTAAELTNTCLASLPAGTFNVRSYLSVLSTTTVTLQNVSFTLTESAPPSGSLEVGVLDGSNDPVVSPTAALDQVNFSGGSQTATGDFVASPHKIRVTNGSNNPEWTLSIAAADGETALWFNGGSLYFDYNDGSNEDDGGDADSYGGKMTITPTGATLTPVGAATSTGITKGSTASFIQGTLSSITLLTAAETADEEGSWDLSNLPLNQIIPASQAADSYSITLTLTVI